MEPKELPQRSRARRVRAGERPKALRKAHLQAKKAEENVEEKAKQEISRMRSAPSATPLKRKRKRGRIM